MSKLDEIQARADAATAGPWIVPPYSSPLRDEVTAPSDSGLSVAVCEVRSPAPNAVFIAQAREDLPKLVAALRAVEAVLVDWDKFAKRCLLRADPASGLPDAERAIQQKMAEDCAIDARRIRDTIRDALS